jgi:hypothetical protein
MQLALPTQTAFVVHVFDLDPPPRRPATNPCDPVENLWITALGKDRGPFYLL